MDAQRAAWANRKEAHAAARATALARRDENGIPDVLGDGTPEQENECARLIAEAGDYGAGAMSVLVRDAGAIGEDPNYVDSPEYHAGVAEERARLSVR